jgi:hypothetical protein
MYDSSDIFDWSEYDAFLAQPKRSYLLEGEAVEAIEVEPESAPVAAAGIPDGTPFTIGYGRGRGCQIVLG